MPPVSCLCPQSFAENTMNELLGWYGYDKVELRDSDDLDIRSYPDGEARHISVLKGTDPTGDGWGREEAAGFLLFIY